MRRFAVFMLVLGSLAFPGTGAHASYVKPLSIEQATDAAAIIVRAVCLEVSQGQYKKGEIVDMDTVGGAAVPRVTINVSTFRIKEVLKNTTNTSYAVGDTFTVKQFAGFKGRTGKLMKTSVPLPEFKKDAEYVLFYPVANKKGAGLTSPIGVYQGVFEVINGVVTSPAMKAMIKRSPKTQRMTKALGAGKASRSEPSSAMPVDDFSGMIKSLVDTKGGPK